MWKDFYAPMAVILSFIALLLAAIGQVNIMVTKNACNTYEVVTGHSTKYSAGTGCLINVDGQWMNAESYMRNNSEIKVK